MAAYQAKKEKYPPYQYILWRRCQLWHVLPSQLLDEQEALMAQIEAAIPRKQADGEA